MEEKTPEQLEAELFEEILNELDAVGYDEVFQKKIKNIEKRGKAYLNDKYGSEINFDADLLAREMLISYCRYGRSNAIEQFAHDFASDLTALAIRGGIVAQEEATTSETDESVTV